MAAVPVENNWNFIRLPDQLFAKTIFEILTLSLPSFAVQLGRFQEYYAAAVKAVKKHKKLVAIELITI